MDEYQGLHQGQEKGYAICQYMENPGIADMACDHVDVEIQSTSSIMV